MVTGQLHGLLLGPLPALDPHHLGLDPEHPADGNAVGVGLDHGLDEAAQLGDVGPFRQGDVGLAAAAPDLHVLQGPDSSSASGPLPFSPARAMAPSKPRPASTEISIWSRVLASSSCMAFWRSCPLL